MYVPISYVNVNAKQACQKRNNSISHMLHGQNRPVTFNLAVEVIAGGFNPRPYRGGGVGATPPLRFFADSEKTVNAKQACQKINNGISHMLHGQNRPVTFNLAVEVIAGGFNPRPYRGGGGTTPPP